MSSPDSRGAILSHEELSRAYDIAHSAKASITDIFYCFRLLLGRSPHLEEWSGHSAQAGQDLDAVVGAYANSLEFALRLAQFRKGNMTGQVNLVILDDFKIYARESDQDVGKPIIEHGIYERHLTAVFKRYLGRGMNVLDVGANIGYFTMLSAALVGPAGSVVAIEPNGSNTRLIEASRRANAFEHVTIVQAAAGRNWELLVLNSTYSNGTTSRPSADLEGLLDAVTVPSIRIDDLVGPDKHIDFIKIDVEGAEYNALVGARQTIQRCHPVIASEFSPGMMVGISGISGAEYLNFFVQQGYSLHVVEASGSLYDCEKNVQKVLDAYEQSRVDHIDLLMEYGPR
jgi:FkbM family methyltransferase